VRENRTKTPICYSIYEALHFDDGRTLASFFHEVLADATFYIRLDVYSYYTEMTSSRAESNTGEGNITAVLI
jgi:hypothetical protein